MGYMSSDIDWWNERVLPSSISFWRENRHRLKWKDISKMRDLPDDFIREFQDELDWDILNRNRNISERMLEEFWDKFDWKDILTRRDFSEDFIRKHKYDLDWNQISYFQGQMSEQFVEEMSNFIVWDHFNPYRDVYDRYSNEFKVKHWDDMQEYIKGARFWGEELKLVNDCGETKILRTKYDIKFGTKSEYL